eukprot:GHUV01053029.1.p2 GENE.GHUV01053029.1~~GHUV01053029.1.p2  ORF type:complete len:105 (-),score=24.81 GHUV01053029.1:227-541(-)
MYYWPHTLGPCCQSQPECLFLTLTTRAELPVMEVKHNGDTYNRYRSRSDFASLQDIPAAIEHHIIIDSADWQYQQLQKRPHDAIQLQPCYKQTFTQPVEHSFLL